MTITVGAPRKSLKKIRDDVAFFAHQTDGVRTLIPRSSFLLADEMGLGKSLTALTVAAVDFEHDPGRRMLIVCPASLKWNWAAEIEKMTHFTYLVLDGTVSARKRQMREFAKGGIDILITNYEQVVAHWRELNEFLFDITIYDEAHYIKGHNSKRSKACLQLNSPRHFLLTGSPLLNHIDDLWGPLHRIAPNEYPSYWAFIQRFAVYGGFKSKQIVGMKNQAELQARVANVMLRREKKDHLDIPDKMYIPITVELHPEQRKMYREAVEELRITIPNNPNPMEIENALTKMLRLRMICGTTAVIEGYEDFSTKLDVGTDRTEEIVGNGDHFVIFTQFRKVQECMAARLERVGIRTTQLNGDVPQKDRLRVIDEWSSGPPSACIAMLQVAGVGLNLTAANKALFLDRLWVPQLNSQAEDRLHRIGASETQPVEILTILCRNTIESRVETLIKRKDRIFSAIVNEDSWKRRLLESLVDEGEEVA